MLEPGEIEESLYRNYLVHYEQIDEMDYSGDRSHLSCEDVLDAHYFICEHFRKLGEGIGGFGPKDHGLLASAVGRQLASAGGKFVYDDFWEIASALIIGLITNHPFHDANKRTAFLCSVFFMLENNYMPRVDIEEVEDFTVDVANFHLKNGTHPTVEDISPSFKTMFRQRDNSTSYIVSFRELRPLLKRYEFFLENPSNGFIDVVRADKTKIYRMAYKGESREVGRKTLSLMRKQLGLTPDQGVDAQAFFKGADPLNKLIGEYESVLKRLADR